MFIDIELVLIIFLLNFGLEETKLKKKKLFLQYQNLILLEQIKTPEKKNDFKNCI